MLDRLPKPTWASDCGRVALYNADCLTLLPLIPVGVVDAVVTDPPYGMDYKPLRGSDGSKLFRDAVDGDDKPFDPAPWLGFNQVILFGANWYASRLPDSGGWIVWDKTPRGIKRGFYASHCELAWTNLFGRVQKFALQWGGEAHDGEDHFHPTQKPLRLMYWCLEQTAGTVLDPYMGSGTCGVAAVKLRRPFIGIEKSALHFETARDRIAAELAQGSLFDHIQAAPEPQPINLF